MDILRDMNGDILLCSFSHANKIVNQFCLLRFC